MKKGCYELGNLAVICQEGQDLPVLDSAASELLDRAFSNAQICAGWEILPARAKIALVQQEILKDLLQDRQASEAWFLLETLQRRVVDVYPWKDHYPSGALES